MIGSTQLRAAEVCLVPNIVVPKDFRVLEFINYTGLECPNTHLQSYYNKMAEVIHDDKMLIYFFQDSLSGSSLSWYMRLENVKIKKWKDLVEAFLKQYKFNLEIAPDRTSLMSMEKRSQGVCTEMEGRGNTCPTSFNRNKDGDFICQYF
jgi:hypothetical protein